MTNIQRIFRNLQTVRPLHKREVINNEQGATGYRSVEDGKEEVIYDVWVDTSALEYMARKAAGNKSGNSSDGPLTIKVVGKRKI